MADHEIETEAADAIEATETAQRERRQAPETTPDPADSPESRRELEAARAALKKANAESAARRKRIEELEAAEREREDAKLGEQEKLSRRAAEAERRLAEAEAKAEKAERLRVRTEIASAVKDEARALGFKYPEDVPKLIDLDALEMDELGRVPGAKEAVERLAKKREGLLESPRGGGTPPRDGPRRPGNPTPQNVDDIARREQREFVQYQF